MVKTSFVAVEYEMELVAIETAFVIGVALTVVVVFFVVVVVVVVVVVEKVTHSEYFIISP